MNKESQANTSFKQKTKVNTLGDEEEDNNQSPRGLKKDDNFL